MTLREIRRRWRACLPRRIRRLLLTRVSLKRSRTVLLSSRRISRSSKEELKLMRKSLRQSVKQELKLKSREELLLESLMTCLKDLKRLVVLLLLRLSLTRREKLKLASLEEILRKLLFSTNQLLLV